MDMSQSINEENRQKLIQQFGFDQPAWFRYLLMLKNYALFELGESYYQNKSVYALIQEKLPVSASLGIWSTLLIYLISIILGIRKAIQHGSTFDVLSSLIVIVCNAIPVFVMAILMLTIFSGGYFFDIFPLKDLVSPDFDTFSWPVKMMDYLWHISLPIFCMVITGLATLMFLTKNSFLDQMTQQYVTCAYAKGLNQKSVLYKHIFRNAMLIVISGFPASFIGMFFTGSLMIEIIFSLDGLGLLGYNAINQLDYPVVFGSLYLFSLMGLLINIVCDWLLGWVDPRIDLTKGTRA
jgi:microcin C transport system permease protein